MEGFSKYTFANPPEILPLRDTETDSPDDDILEALGFDPHDDRLLQRVSHGLARAQSRGYGNTDAHVARLRLRS